MQHCPHRMSPKREPAEVQSIDEGADITRHFLEGVALASRALTVASEIESDAAPPGGVPPASGLPPPPTNLSPFISLIDQPNSRSVH